MPLYALTVRGELEGVTRVAPSADFTWRIKLRCNACREDAPAVSVFTAADAAEIPGSRGTAHLVQKCKACSEVWTVDVTPTKGSELNPDTAGGVEIAVFEARGAV